MTSVYLAASLSVVACVVLWPFVGPLTRPRPRAVGVLLGAHVLFALIPAMQILSESGRPHDLRHVLAGWIALPALMLGAALPTLARTTTPRSFVRSLSQQVALSRADASALRRHVRWLTALAVGLLLAYMATVRTFALGSLISGQYADARLERRAATVGPPGVGRIFAQVQIFYMPLLVGVVVAAWPWLRRRRQRWVGAVALGTALVYCAYPGSKTPVAILFAVAGCVALDEASRRTAGPGAAPRPSRQRRRAKAILFAAVIGMVAYPVFIFALTPFGADRAGIDIVVDGVIPRLSEKPAINSNKAFDLYPDAEGRFTYGRDIPLVARLTGGEQVALSTQVAVAHGFDPFVNSPPSTLGAAWVQGGWPGVVFVYVLVGFAFSSTEAMLCRQQPHPVVVALLALLMVGAVRISMGYHHAVLLSETILPVLLTFWAWKVLLRRQATRAPRRRVASAANRPGVRPRPGAIAHAIESEPHG